MLQPTKQLTGLLAAVLCAVAALVGQVLEHLLYRLIDVARILFRSGWNFILGNAAEDGALGFAIEYVYHQGSRFVIKTLRISEGRSTYSMPSVP
jgi:hypothetical protein